MDRRDDIQPEVEYDPNVDYEGTKVTLTREVAEKQKRRRAMRDEFEAWVLEQELSRLHNDLDIEWLNAVVE